MRVAGGLGDVHIDMSSLLRVVEEPTQIRKFVSNLPNSLRVAEC
jgi:hypothetical protein